MKCDRHFTGTINFPIIIYRKGIIIIILILVKLIIDINISSSKLLNTNININNIKVYSF